MRILLDENVSHRLDFAPADGVVDDMAYCVLDLGSKDDGRPSPDFFFHPLTGMEEFNSAAAVLRVTSERGIDVRLKLPLNWHLAAMCPETMEIQMMELTEIHEFSAGGRGDEILALNPLKQNPWMTISPPRVAIEEVFKDVKWHTPAGINPKEALAIPLADGREPICVFASRKSIRTDGISLSDIL